MPAAHKVSQTLHEDVFYPTHAPRAESEEYSKIHHQMVVTQDMPCYICGIKHSDLTDSEKNPDGVQALETHHLWVEWSLMNAVDQRKLEAVFGKIEDAQAWVDHNQDNLLVLCDRHHRHREVGIHDLTFPIWIAQKFVKDDYELTTGDNQDPTSTSPTGV
jgi:hypothetical protein